MYNLSHFKAQNPEEVLAFMKAHPFIVLCGTDANNNAVATHIPVLLEERNDQLFIQAHVMRKQEHTAAFEQNPNVLAIFHGNHAYVSANMYEQKNVASTWNYQAVHAKGIIRFLDDKGLYNLLVKLTDHFEGNTHSPAAVKNLSEEYVANHMKAIVAFEIEITDIQHVFKLSQNHNKKNFDNIVEKFTQGTTEQQYIADEMLKRKEQLFDK